METRINISVKELNEVCALPDRKWSTKAHFNLVNRSLVHEVFKYQKFQDDFASIIVCTNDGKGDFIGSFKSSYEEFLFSIINALGLNPKKEYVDNEDLTKKLHEKIAFLKTLPDEAWLYNNFPVLYRNLQRGRKYIKEVEQSIKNSEYIEIAKEDKDYYYSCAMSKNFDNFMQKQVESYRRFTDSRFKYKKLIENKKHNDFISKNYDQNKLAMYLAHKYLCVCENNLNNKKYLMNYMELLIKYLKSDYDKTVSITVDHKIIDFNNIVSRINELKLKTDKMIVSKVDWALIPAGKTDKYVKKGLDPQKHYLTEEELAELRRVGNEKDNFYLKNSPILKIYGPVLKKYGILVNESDYVAYVYSNGEVLFDTEYDEKHPRKVKGNAIYYMKAIYFDMVSGLDKPVLKKHPQVDTINHNETWTKRAQKLLDYKGTPEEQEQAKQLVKRIIEQNEKDS